MKRTLQVSIFFAAVTVILFGSLPTRGEQMINIDVSPMKGSPAVVTGRVLTTSGRGISRAVVRIYNTETDEVRMRVTNTFGYYRFPDMNPGFYIVTVAHKRHLFLDASRSFELEHDLAGIDFMAGEDE